MFIRRMLSCRWAYLPAGLEQMGKFSTFISLKRVKWPRSQFQCVFSGLSFFRWPAIVDERYFYVRRYLGITPSSIPSGFLIELCVALCYIFMVTAQSAAGVSTLLKYWDEVSTEKIGPSSCWDPWSFRKLWWAGMWATSGISTTTIS